MAEEWIKVCRIITVDNLVARKEFVDNTIEIWKKLLDNYKIKYKFDVEQGTQFFDGFRGQYENKVFSIYLYTTKEEAQRMKEIINDYENTKSEISSELNQNEEENDVEIKTIKVSNIILEILLILLIILEISVMIISKDEIDNKQLYIMMAIVIFVELYCIFLINKEKRKNKDE